MCVRAKSLQSCPTLCSPMDCKPFRFLSMGFSRQEYWSGLPCPPPGDLPDPGIESVSLKPLEFAGGYFTTSSTWKAHSTSLCVHVQLFQSYLTLWTVAHQAPLSIGFSKPEYWSGLPFPSPGDLPTPGIKATSPALHVDSLPIESFSSVQFSRSVASDCL